jgi:hypothetical protein
MNSLYSSHFYQNQLITKVTLGTLISGEDQANE